MLSRSLQGFGLSFALRARCIRTVWGSAIRLHTADPLSVPSSASGFHGVYRRYRVARAGSAAKLSCAPKLAVLWFGGDSIKGRLHPRKTLSSLATEASVLHLAAPSSFQPRIPGSGMVALTLGPQEGWSSLVRARSPHAGRARLVVLDGCSSHRRHPPEPA